MPVPLQTQTQTPPPPPPGTLLAIPEAQYGVQRSRALQPGQSVRTLHARTAVGSLHWRTRKAQTGKWAARGLGDRGSQAGGFKELEDQSANHC
ncbi:hypothetical protein V8C34DRAFT_311990 [Trichoderma compactum]